MNLIKTKLSARNFNLILKAGLMLGMANFFLPIASAQTFQTVARSISNVLGLVIPILFSIATIIFLWGVITYITAAGEEGKITEGRNYIIWGLIGLFVMVAIWGIVALIGTFFFPGGIPVGAPNLPQLPGISGGTPQQNSNPFGISPSNPFGTGIARPAPIGGVSNCIQQQNGVCTVQCTNVNPDGTCGAYQPVSGNSSGNINDLNFPNGAPAQNCTNTRDGLCEDYCAFGTDLDCTGGNPTNNNSGATVPQNCSNVPDGLCEENCAFGPDIDCTGGLPNQPGFNQYDCVADPTAPGC